VGDNRSGLKLPVEDRLRHVYWVGGGSGAGKSTIARKIAAKHGFQIYDTDSAMGDHGTRTSPEHSPFLRQFVDMDMDERWVNRSPQAMLETFHWFRGEGFDLIVDDLLALPSDPPVIAEGFRLLPSLVKPLLAASGRAAWLLPTPEFRRAVFEGRRPSGPPWTFVNETSNPERALANLLERDRMFTDELRDEARRLGLHVIEVGLGTTEDDTAELVMSALAL
jgi:2-phosphoglycerate kinase